VHPDPPDRVSAENAVANGAREKVNGLYQGVVR
jgi:hypothetical protein